MKAIIVEDEPYALLLNKQMLEKVGDIEIIATFVNPEEAIPAIIDLQPEVLFIDIEMPGMNGFQVIEAVMDQVPEMEIVFITSYAQYALKAFEVHALDYLLKPLTLQQVQHLLPRLLKYRRQVSPILEMTPQQAGMIQLFGRFKLISPSGNEEVKWLSAKSEELLIFLLVQKDYTATKQVIIEELWPDLDYDAADVNFHTAMHRLKKTLMNAQMSIVIHKNKGSYRLVLGNVTCDKDKFERGIEELTTTWKGDKHKFRAWFEVYRGNLSENNHYTWLHFYRQRFLQNYILLTKQMISSYNSLYTDSEIEQILQRVLEFSPFEEELHEFLLALWYKKQKRTLFLRHYAQVQQLWRAELGLDVSPTWQSWYKEFMNEV